MSSLACKARDVFLAPLFDQSKKKTVSTGLEDYPRLEGERWDLESLTKKMCAVTFILEWNGSRTPHGVRFGDYTIGSMLRGNVTAIYSDGSFRRIGTYERIEEFSGPLREHHACYVHIYPQFLGEK